MIEGSLSLLGNPKLKTSHAVVWLVFYIQSRTEAHQKKKLAQLDT